MNLLADRRGLVFGVANDHSLAWAIARRCAAAGARLYLSHGDARLERRLAPLAAQIGAATGAPCDVRDDAQLDATVAAAAAALGGPLDFVVHSVAFADREDLAGDFVDTRREGFARALDVSAYSLVAITRRVLPHLTPGAGSVLTLTYAGSSRVVPGYNVMGPAKAALESAVRYLAVELGPRGVRVNALSAGPVRTLAAAGLAGFRDLHRAAGERAPLRRNVSADEVADAALFLLCDLSRAVTGEVLHVDAGLHALGL